MRFFRTLAITLSIVSSSAVMAADTENSTTSTPAATVTPVVTPAAATAAPAHTNPATTPTSSTPASHPHHEHHSDGTPTSSHHTAGTPHHNANNSTNGAATSACGVPIYDENGALLNNDIAGCYSTTIAPTYPPAIISNGVTTYPPGRVYQDTNGLWQTCEGLLVIDAWHTTICQPPVVAVTETPASIPAKPIIAPTPENSLSSDSNKKLRSDKDMY